MERFSTPGFPPGSVVTFSPAEIDAWIRAEVPKTVSQGVRDPKIVLAQDGATASALVDFVKVEQARGKTPGMVAKMFAGERQLKISTRIVSSGGRCTVFLNRLELGGVGIEGRPLDLLISTFFKSFFPDAHIDEPFDLDDNIERIEFRPDVIRVHIRK